MYEFIDINETQNGRPLPSVAMNFDGDFIENQLEGYRTLNVSGRETISYEPKIAGDSSSIDGTVLAGKTLPARELTIQYKLVADNNKDLQDKFRELLWILHSQEDVRIYFNDDDAIEYLGQLTVMDEVPPNVNQVIGSFVIYCQKPYKYSRLQNTYENSSNSVTIGQGNLSPYEITPTLIRLRPRSSMNLRGKSLTVTNNRTNRQIVLNFTTMTENLTIDATNSIDIKINDNTIQLMKITTSGETTTYSPIGNVNYTKYLVFETTDFHSFKVRAQDSIRVNDTGFGIEIAVRGEWV